MVFEIFVIFAGFVPQPSAVHPHHYHLLICSTCSRNKTQCVSLAESALHHCPLT